MYRFSRSIYRELSPRICSSENGRGSASRQRLLEACEGTMRRLACDRRHFARPARTLFDQVRGEFPLADQVHVLRVIDRYVSLAVDHLEQLPGDIRLDGRPHQCQASTRKGQPCQREPLPGREYCPSHKHLEEAFSLEALEEVGAAA